MLNQLANSAEGLVNYNPAATREVEPIAHAIAAHLSSSLKSRSDLAELIGTGNLPLMESNHENHFQYVSSLGTVFEPTAFVEIIIWVLRTYTGKGFSLSYWTVMLPEAKNLLQSHTSQETFETLGPVYDWLLTNLNDLATVSDENHSFFEKLTQLYGGESAHE